MKLIQCTSIKGEDGEYVYTNELVMISDDLIKLQAKANDLCHSMGIQSKPWCSRYPVMGTEEIKSNREWVMRLDMSIGGFIIEK